MKVERQRLSVVVAAILKAFVEGLSNFRRARTWNPGNSLVILANKTAPAPLVAKGEETGI